MLVGLYPLSAGDAEALRFRTFSPKGGFYYDGVVDISQDTDGFIWVMLDRDLLRFDGYEYQKYNSQFEAVGNGEDASFRSFARDRHGRLLVLTDNAVYNYDAYADRYVKLISNKFSSLAIDSLDNMWCVHGDLLCRVNPADGTLHESLCGDSQVKGITGYAFTNDRLFFASTQGLVYTAGYDAPDNLTLLCKLPEAHSIVEITAGDGDLWVLTALHGIFRIDPATGSVKKHIDCQEDNAPAKAFLFDRNGRIWLGSQLGLYIIDPSTGSYHRYLHSRTDPFSLTNNSVWVLFGDRHGNVWTGHFAGGLGYADLNDGIQVTTATTAMHSLNYELVSSFAEDGDMVYIGMDGGGINRLDKRNGVITALSRGDGSDMLSYHHVKSLVTDPQRRLWIAMYRDGLASYDLGANKLRRFRRSEKGLRSDNLRKVELDGDSALWIAYQNINPVVSRLSLVDESFAHFSLTKGDGYVFDIQIDPYGNLYALTRRSLYRIDAGSPEVTTVCRNAFSGGQSLAVDGSGNVWIGTVGRGLMRYSPWDGTFEERKGPAEASAIYSLCDDRESGSLWLGTDNGLFRYDVESDSYRRFDGSDGFQGQVYYPLSAYRSHSGLMYFVGTNGFSVFNPGSIKTNPRPPQPRISKFYIDNKPVSSSVWKGSPAIELNYDQANFGFRFSSDNYQTPEKNLFRYRLIGYDDDWITTDASNRTAMYAKVPPGDYIFEVMAANNDGTWNTTPAAVRIVRNPAPWASPMAYMIYALLAGLIIWFVYHYWEEKRRMKIKLFMESLDKQKKDELHKSQLRFFTNISHDFRTPISLILAVTDNMRQEGLKDNYYRILHNNSRRLLNLVNELMDFRTLDNNKMKLNVQPVDANAMVRNLAADFDNYAMRRGISLTVNCNQAIPDVVCADRQILEKVVMNLLNNSFKYTPDGGVIGVETYRAESQFTPRFSHSYRIEDDAHVAGDVFVVAVRDTGCGIAPGSLKEVFDRYNTVDTTNLNQHLGTGIGLALVKSLVLLHHGTITIYSEENEGTEIVVVLPDCGCTDGVDSPSAGVDTASVSGSAGSLMAPDEEPDANDPDPGADLYVRRDRKRILLVEDHDDLRTLIAGFLRLHYDIAEASDGMEAAEMLSHSAPDLIISDIMMPRKDGITLCREVKGDVATSHIPVMLLTARTGVENQLEGVDAGADIYFSKPIDFNLLLRTIENIFRHQHNLREHYARNYYADRSELTSNRQDADFLDKITEVIDAHLEGDNIDVNMLASELCMSRSKLYSKLKALTGRSIVEFILNYRMRKAARLIVEQDVPLYRVMEQVGIRSQSHFINAFKKEFGETPSAFQARHRKKEMPVAEE